MAKVRSKPSSCGADRHQKQKQSQGQLPRHPRGTLRTNSTDDKNPAAFNRETVSHLKLPDYQVTQSHPHCSLWNADRGHGSVTATVAGRFTNRYLTNVLFLLYMQIHQFCEATMMWHEQAHVHTAHQMYSGHDMWCVICLSRAPSAQLSGILISCWNDSHFSGWQAHCNDHRSPKLFPLSVFCFNSSFFLSFVVPSEKSWQIQATIPKILLMKYRYCKWKHLIYSIFGTVSSKPMTSQSVYLYLLISKCWDTHKHFSVVTVSMFSHWHCQH